MLMLHKSDKYYFSETDSFARISHYEEAIEGTVLRKFHHIRYISAVLCNKKHVVSYKMSLHGSESVC